MIKYNPKIHKRKSIRLKDYDYTRLGYYFITISSKNREHTFGEISNGRIELNTEGFIIDKCLNEIQIHFPKSRLDYYCIMPNHIHFIVVIDDCGDRNDCRRDTACRVPTEAFGKPISGSLPTIIRSLKSAITKRINEFNNSGGFSVWQAGYYEHIIRNEKELNEIRYYIECNALNWKDDEFAL